MKLHLSKIGLLVGMATLAGASFPADAAKLQNVKVNTLRAGQTAIEFQFDGAVPSYTDVLKYRPNYLLLNVADSENGLTSNNVPVNRGAVRDVTLVNSGANLQMRVGLNDLVPYKVTQKGNSLVVDLGQNGQTMAARANSGASSAAAINTINNVDFKKLDGTTGKVVISLDNNSAAVDVSPRGNAVQIRFNATSVSSDQLQSYDVSDFGTVVKGIAVSRRGNNAVVDIACNSMVEVRHDQKGNNLEVVISKKKEPRQELPKYNGKPISLNFQDVPVRTVLQLIADFNNFNLVTTDTVKGNITIRLDSVPWEQALETILRVKGLDKRLDGNILLVAQAKELADLEQQKLESKKKVEELAPLVQEYIQVNYAKASDIANLLGTSKNDANTVNNSILSPRGSVSIDARTNTLIVKDTSESIDQIMELVKKLDIPVKQVSIEARIVTIDENVTDELGVNWSFAKAQHNSFQKAFPLGSSTLLDPYGMSADSGSGSDSQHSLELDAGDVNHGHFMSQTAFNTTTQGFGISIGKIWDNVLVDMYLSALESETKAEVIASPRVTTANQKQALIEQGTMFPTEVSTSSGATSVEWQKAVLSLNVTPQITPDNRIILDLKVTQDTLGDTVQTGTGSAQAINTQQVTTQVLVENGETIVLGGIYQQNITKTVTKVPLLGDIPFLGALFRYTSDKNTKRELLIFVTPKIIVDKQ